ncbi:hypothetical protein ACXR8U_11150 [Methylobacterium radiotolerans]
MPVPLHNPRRTEVIHHFEAARGVGAETELLVYFVGHSTNRETHDLNLVLGVDDGGNDKVMSLTQLLHEARDANFARIVCILDTCHAGRTRRTFAQLLDQSFAMFATGDAYAFEANFSDALLRAFEQPIRKNDQRVDRLAGGITYARLFEEARRRLVVGNPRDSQHPVCFGDLGDTVVVEAPNVVSDRYNVFASDRTVYGRIFILLRLIRDEGRPFDALVAAARGNAAFLLKAGEAGGDGTYVSRTRLSDYVDFLRKVRWVAGRNDGLSVTPEGRDACAEERSNRALIDAVERYVLPADLTLVRLDEFVQGLLRDMIPPTPGRISDRAAMSGHVLRLDGATRIALLLLPTTGRFMKGAADAIFPAAVG